MSEPNYVTCNCQHCSGHIKFDGNQLRKGETSLVDCPHCHLQTIIFHPVSSGEGSKSNQVRGESRNRDTNAKQPKSSKAELLLFEGTRFITLLGSVLVLIALIVVAILVIKTFQPPKPPQIIPVSYEVVAPVQPTAQPNENTFVPIGGKLAAANSFPQPVADFLFAHEGFSLKEWLDQLWPQHRQAFLDNLAAILQTAKTKNLTYDETEQVVRDFSNMWITLNQSPPDPNAAMQKEIVRASCVSIAFGLFISLTILCLILVLLAIERNTRLAAQKPVDIQN
jgi:hypothetical protein